MPVRQSTFTKPAVLTATLALCLIPCVGVGAVVASVSILAQIPSGPGEIAAQLADKSIAYWFLTLAGVAIASWTWIFKWLLNQLELQRKAHTDATTQLIAFMQTDHTATTTLLASSQTVLAATQQALTTLAQQQIRDK